MNTGIALVINLGLNFVLIPIYGIMGAAISWAVAILVRNLLPLTMINRMLGMSPFGSASAWVSIYFYRLRRSGSDAFFGCRARLSPP